MIVCLRVLQQQDQRQEQIVGEGVAVLLRRPSIDRCPNNRRGRGRAISRETHQQHINSKTYQQHINAKTIGMKSGKALILSAKSVVFLSDRCWTWSTLLFSIRKCKYIRKYKYAYTCRTLVPKVGGGWTTILVTHSNWAKLHHNSKSLHCKGW